MLIPNSYTRNGEAKYELQIRSFFVSTKTGKKTWDEPPSGACVIEYANEEVRRMAEAQKQDLECVHLPHNNNDSNAKDSKNHNRRMGNRIMKLIKRRNENGKGSDSDNGTNERRRVSVKKGSGMHNILNESQKFVNNDYDLECALANSMSESNDLERVLAKSLHDSCGKEKDEDEEELALATALSLSMKQLPLDDNVKEKNVASTGSSDAAEEHTCSSNII
jgi:hypothetical protein